MKKYFKKTAVFIIIILVLLLVACGGRPTRLGGMQPEAYRDGVDRLKESKSKSYRHAKRNGGSIEKDDDEAAPASGEKESKPVRRIVIYHGYYTIIVESVPVALKEAEALAKKFGGYIESASTGDRSRRAGIRLRVPVEKFDEALKGCEKLGEVKSREVRARDVTRQFHDTRLRLNTNRMVLNRMKALLQKTKKVEERVKILREIERLTAEIETLTRRLNYLKRQAAYSTIDLKLEARLMGSVEGYIPSAIRWIALLKPERRTIYDGGSDVAFENPPGFFNNRYGFYKQKQNTWLYTLPRGGAGIRIGTVKNEPMGTSRFWRETLEFELKNRKYSFAKGRLGDAAWFRISLPDKSIYEIFILPGEENIAVVESLFDGEKTAGELRSRVHNLVKTVRLK